MKRLKKTKTFPNSLLMFTYSLLFIPTFPIFFWNYFTFSVGLVTDCLCQNMLETSIIEIVEPENIWMKTE